MASHILIYEFAQKIPQIQKKTTNFAIDAWPPL